MTSEQQVEAALKSYEDVDNRKPDQRSSYDIRYLKHRRSDSLRQKSAEFIFSPTSHRKSDHITAASDRRRPCRQSRQIQDYSKRR